MSAGENVGEEAADSDRAGMDSHERIDNLEERLDRQSAAGERNAEATAKMSVEVGRLIAAINDMARSTMDRLSQLDANAAGREVTILGAITRVDLNVQVLAKNHDALSGGIEKVRDELVVLRGFDEYIAKRVGNLDRVSLVDGKSLSDVRKEVAELQRSTAEGREKLDSVNDEIMKTGQRHALNEHEAAQALLNQTRAETRANLEAEARRVADAKAAELEREARAALTLARSEERAERSWFKRNLLTIVATMIATVVSVVTTSLVHYELKQIGIQPQHAPAAHHPLSESE